MTVTMKCKVYVLIYTSGNHKEVEVYDTPELLFDRIEKFDSETAKLREAAINQLNRNKTYTVEHAGGVWSFELYPKRIITKVKSS